VNDLDPFPAEPPRPRLWNPVAAVCWSLVFSPAFGAWLHAANWRTLARPDRARASMGWVWATAVLLGVNAATVLLPDSRLLNRLFPLAGLVLLLAWYFVLGREQVRVVSDTVGTDYEQRRWGWPIAVATAAVLAYIALIAGLVFFVYEPSPAEVADEIRPQLLAEWRAQPALRDAMIRAIELTPAGDGRYTGWVDATFGGVPVRLTLTARVHFDTLEWEVKLPEPNR
jgi:hypothetical protein